MTRSTLLLTMHNAFLLRILLVTTLVLGAYALFVPASFAQAKACGAYSVAYNVPTGYGAAYNVFSTTRELLLQAQCDTAGFSATVGTSATSPANFAVYSTGYRWDGSQWVAYTLEPNGGSASGSYVMGNAKSGATLAYTGEHTYWVSFACVMNNNAWKCGCRDTYCQTPYWNLQVTYNPPPVTPPTTGGGGGTGGGGASGGKVTIDGTRFVKDGKTFYPIADTAWLLDKLNETDLDYYVKTRACQGFNAIQFGTGVSDMSKLDRIFNKLEQYGMYAMPLPNENDGNAMDVVQRYKNRSILVSWTIGGIDANVSPESAVVALMKKVRAADPKTLLSAHPDQSKSSSAYSQVNPLTDFHYIHNCCKQQGGTLTKDLTSTDLARKDKPVFVGEPPYEGPRISSANVLKDLNNFYSVNPAGIAYGHDSVWSMHLPGAPANTLWTRHKVTIPWNQALKTIVTDRITQIAIEKGFTKPAFCN